MTREPTWFEQVSPSLLRNRPIRDYLTQQPEKDWPEVLKATILYGILTLKKQYPGRILFLSELRSILEACQVADTVEESIPEIRSELGRLQQQLGQVTEVVAQPPEWQAPHIRHGVETENEVAVMSASADGLTGSVHDRAMYRLLGPAAKAPTDWWRDDTRTWSPPGRKRSPGRSCHKGSYQTPAPDGAVYPAWWGDGSDTPPQPKVELPQREPRPPPRLAYSVPAVPEEAPMYVDDLVTSKHLNVPSSGYGSTPNPSGPPSFHFPSQGGASAATGGTTAMLYMPHDPHTYPAQQHLGQAQPNPSKAAAAAAAAAAKGAKSGAPLFALLPSGVMVPVDLSQARSNEKASHRPCWQGPNRSTVQSKVKEMVERDKEEARKRVEARRRAVATALGVSSQRGTSTSSGGPRPSNSQPGTSPQSDLADRLASSPWTSWFMEGKEGSSGPKDVGGPEDGAVTSTYRPSEPSSSVAGPDKPQHHPQSASPMSVSEAGPGQGLSQWLQASGERPGLPSSSGMGAPQGPATSSGAGTAPSVATSQPAQPSVDPFNVPGLVAGTRGVKWEVPLADKQSAKYGSLGQPRSSSTERPVKPIAGVRPEVGTWARAWVGDFGHLEPDKPRFPPEDAFKFSSEVGMDELVERMKRRLAAEVAALSEADASGTSSMLQPNTSGTAAEAYALSSNHQGPSQGQWDAEEALARAVAVAAAGAAAAGAAAATRVTGSALSSSSAAVTGLSPSRSAASTWQRQQHLYASLAAASPRARLPADVNLDDDDASSTVSSMSMRTANLLARSFALLEAGFNTPSQASDNT